MFVLTASLPAIAKSNVVVRQSLRCPRAPLTELELEAERQAKWDCCWRCGGPHSKSSCTATAEQAKEAKKLQKSIEADRQWIYDDSHRCAPCAPCLLDVSDEDGAMGEKEAADVAVGRSGELLEFDPSSLRNCENPFQAWCDFLLAAFHDSRKQSLEVQLKGNAGSGHTYTYPAANNVSVNQIGKSRTDNDVVENSWNDSRRTTWLVLR